MKWFVQIIWLNQNVLFAPLIVHWISHWMSHQHTLHINEVNNFKAEIMYNLNIYYFRNWLDARFFREGEDGIWEQLARIYTKTNATSYQVTGLTPFTVYSFRLLAVNKLGISPPSKESYYIVTLREGESFLLLGSSDPLCLHTHFIDARIVNYYSRRRCHIT